MDIEEVAGGVFLVEGSRTNFVLVVDGAELTMIDSGYPKDRDLVDTAVTKIGRSLADVHALVLTHGHPDHTGSAERLRSDHDVPVHCHTPMKSRSPVARSSRSYPSGSCARPGDRTCSGSRSTPSEPVGSNPSM